MRVKVIAHGMGGGHVSYLTEIKFLSESGYMVFAYDMTATVQSTGESMRGMPQAVMDLDEAIDYVHSISDLPVLLYGHSMGGYAVMSVLDQHPEIAGVVQKSGFNSSAELFVEFGAEMAGDWFKSTLPLVKAYECLKFGSGAFASSIKGLQNSKTPVMMLHSVDDSVISYEDSFTRYQTELKNREDIVYVSFDKRNHDPILKESYHEEVATAKAVLQERYAESDGVPSEVMSDFYQQFKDFDNQYDWQLLSEIVAFYDECVK